MATRRSPWRGSPTGSRSSPTPTPSSRPPWSGSPPGWPGSTTPRTDRVSDHIEYADWGERFFRSAVSAERVLAGINVLAGQKIDVGPMGVGPGRVVKVTALGEIGTAVGERVSDDPVTFAVLAAGVAGVRDQPGRRHPPVHRRPEHPADPHRPGPRGPGDPDRRRRRRRPSEVGCELKAQGLRASITQHAANVEGELKRFVVEVRHPRDREALRRQGAHHRRLRRDRQGGAATSRRATAQTDELTSDLAGALEAEILEHGEAVRRRGAPAETLPPRGSNTF